MKLLKSLSLLTLFALLTPTAASAHVIGANGFPSGITHPLFGLDHLLAMIAVGIIAVQTGGRAIWAVPLAFVSAMIIGGILGISGVALPFVETWIALSVLFCGIIITIAKKLPTTLAMTFAALFALFHGHAHGTEMLTATNPVLFISGFLISTILLHIVGVITGVYAKKTSVASQILKSSGLALSLAGIALLL